MKSILPVVIFSLFSLIAYAEEGEDLSEVRAEDVQTDDSEHPSSVEVASVGSDLNVFAGESSYQDNSEGEAEFGPLSRVNMNYFGILYGPSIRNPKGYQPSNTGNPDSEKPVIVKNFLNVGYGLSDTIGVTASAYWIWQPVMGQQMTLQDPFLRVSHNSIYHDDLWNLYGDVRVHLPVTDVSRINDMNFGVQSVQVLSYRVPRSRLTVGSYGSVRVNSFGGKGYGNDMELYVAPNAFYQITPTVSLTCLYEIQTSHTFGNKAFAFNEDGMDLEPGVSWDVTPNLMVNPYLHLPIGSGFTLASTSVGMMLNWILI
jgi:hypothetical protein